MTEEKLKSVLVLYMNEFARMNHVPVRNGNDLEHTYWMCAETLNFLREGRREKVMRWLGFIQGVLWCRKVYTIDEMRDHNRPDAE